MSFDGGYRLLSTDFQSGATLRISGENGESHTSYAVKPGPMAGASIGFMPTSNLGIAVAVSRFARSTPAILTASIPNPFFFGQARSVTGDISGLRQEQLTVHIQGRGSVYIGKRFQVSAFGGPSIFRITQDIVTDFTYHESYPYLDASFGAAQTTSEARLKVGFNAGGDGAFYFTRHVGIGIAGLFSRANVEMPSDGGNSVVVKAGGVQIGAGMRFRF